MRQNTHTLQPFQLLSPLPLSRSYTIVWAHGESYTGFGNDFEIALTPEQIAHQSPINIAAAHLPLACFATKSADALAPYEPATLIRIDRDPGHNFSGHDRYTFQWADGRESTDYARNFRMVYPPGLSKPFDPFEL